MNYTEIIISNPINTESIIALFNEIEVCDSKFLIINIGEHEFESLAALKELKNMFYKRKVVISRFTKIAFLHPAKYQNESQDIAKHNYFSDKEKALIWFDEK